MQDWMKEYYGKLDTLPKEVTSLSLKDFPAAHNMSDGTASYLRTRYIDPLSNRLWNMRSVYFTEIGICFMLKDHKGNLSYTERITEPALNGIGRRWVFPAMPMGSFLFIPWVSQELPRMNTSKLFIVEGPTDALRIHLTGRLAIALLGIGVTHERLDALYAVMSKVWEKPYPMILLPDNDGPGRKFAAWLAAEAPITIRRIPDKYKDVSSMPYSDLVALLELA